MQKCSKNIKLLISRDLDGDLSGEEQTFLVEYLSKHEECKKYKDEVAFLKNAMYFSLSGNKENNFIVVKQKKGVPKFNLVLKIAAIFILILAIGILSTTITINTKSYLAKKEAAEFYYEPLSTFSEYVYGENSNSNTSETDNFYDPMEEYVMAINY